jgi:hypothetical protein
VVLAMEKEEEISEEKLKAIAEKVKNIDLNTLMKAFVEMLRAYSEMAIRVGVLQRDNQDAFEAINYLGSIAPQVMRLLAKKAPPAELGAFIQAIMDLIEIGPKLDKLNEAPAEDKIQIGEKLGKIADALEEMINKVPEQEKSGEGTP